MGQSSLISCKHTSILTLSDDASFSLFFSFDLPRGCQLKIKGLFFKEVDQKAQKPEHTRQSRRWGECIVSSEDGQVLCICDPWPEHPAMSSGYLDVLKYTCVYTNICWYANAGVFCSFIHWFSMFIFHFLAFLKSDRLCNPQFNYSDTILVTSVLVYKDLHIVFCFTIFLLTY